MNEALLKNFDPVVQLVLSWSGPVISSLVAILVGLIITMVLRAAVRPWARKLSPQALLVIRKAITYSVTAIVVITILQQFGFKLTALLGAAGIAGIAVGFAAQTSLSNMISGIFLIWEKPFQVGDVIIVAGTKGVVESIDLLSMTLRTLDNLSVRIPNETLVKSELINITKHPVRRFDILFGVSYRSDPDHVMRVLRRVAAENPFVLDEPKPLIAFTGFGESELSFKYGVWHEKDDWIAMRNAILTDLKNTLEDEGIEIPYPHRVIVSSGGRPDVVDD
ncbi:MAG: mechanosensitive ion channel family protein [Verrucomicrobiales bacterium]|nr:mechanosensitive ion channel family protein [Verrucomicrobiales bacterium]